MALKTKLLETLAEKAAQWPGKPGEGIVVTTYRKPRKKASKAVPAEVQAFVDACKEHGFTWEIVSPTILRVSGKCGVNNLDRFQNLDMHAANILRMVPLKGGSMWGTDGGSVGGASALRTGYYTLSRSGQGAKRFLAALAKVPVPIICMCGATHGKTAEGDDGQERCIDCGCH